MSILSDVKQVLGIPQDVTYFNQDLLIHINSVLSIANQLGVGPEEGYALADEYSDWTDLLGNEPRLNDVKTYVCQRVRLLFDPPASSTVIEAMNRTIQELEWRITVAASNK